MYKNKQIESETFSNYLDLISLKQIDSIKLKGKSEGFINDKIRYLTWKYLLLEKSIKNVKNKLDYAQTKNKYSNIIHVDSIRSLHHLSCYKNISNYHLQFHQKNLELNLNLIFAQEPEHNYYQGFNDVAGVCYRIFGQEMGYFITKAIAEKYFIDYIIFPFDKTICTANQIHMEMLRQENPKAYEKIKDFNKSPVFTISWYITWFTHQLEDISTICRIYDFLLCSPVCMIIYLVAAVQLQIIVTLKDDDQATLFQAHKDLSNINWKEAFQIAQQFYSKYNHIQIAKQLNIQFEKGCKLSEKDEQPQQKWIDMNNLKSLQKQYWWIAIYVGIWIYLIRNDQK